MLDQAQPPSDAPLTTRQPYVTPTLEACQTWVQTTGISMTYETDLLESLGVEE